MFGAKSKNTTQSRSAPRAVSGELTIQSYAGVVVATIGRPSLLDAREIASIGRELTALVGERATRKLVLDFTHVRQLSSQSIGMLLDLNKLAKEIKGKIVLCGVGGPVARLFELTKLDALFEIYKDDAAALKSFGVRVD